MDYKGFDITIKNNNLTIFKMLLNHHKSRPDFIYKALFYKLYKQKYITGINYLFSLELYNKLLKDNDTGLYQLISQLLEKERIKSNISDF